MRNKFHATLLITAVGAALTIAGPAAAQRGHGGGSGGGVNAGGGARAGGGPAQMGGPARIGGPARVDGGAMQSRGAAQVSPRGPVYSGEPAYNRGATVAGRNFNRGDFRYHRGYHRRPGFAIGVGTGAFAAYPWGYDPYYDYGYGYYDDDYIDGDESYAAVSDADVQYCIQRFRSYDVATRTYLGFDGLRHPCP